MSSLPRTPSEVPTYVIGVDPGVSTGVFVVRNGEKFFVYQGDQEGACAALARVLQRCAREDARVVIACERYLATGGGRARTHQSVPQQVIGRVIGIATSFGYHVTLQAPVDVKRIAPNELLRRLGFHVSRSEVNQRDANDVNDAARHAVLILVTQFATVFEQLLNAQP